MNTAVVIGSGIAAFIVLLFVVLKRARLKRLELLKTNDAPAAEQSKRPRDDAPRVIIKQKPPPKTDEHFKRGLSKTSAFFQERLNRLIGTGIAESTENTQLFEELEETLLMADVGVAFTMGLLDSLRLDLKNGCLKRDASSFAVALKKHMGATLNHASNIDPMSAKGPHPRVILFVGVNGVGKTTTIGKIASAWSKTGKTVVLAAGDTFRAAAVQQLSIWGERTGCRVIQGEPGTDPASVIFNAVQHSVDTQADVVLADTAGRLHTNAELMQELVKVKRAANKARNGAPDEIWLVVDATTGQNALLQAKQFHESVILTGLIVTKLDGTAKGGVLVAMAEALKLPIHFVGVGEQVEDLRPFDPKAYLDALFTDHGGCHISNDGVDDIGTHV